MSKDILESITHFKAKNKILIKMFDEMEGLDYHQANYRKLLELHHKQLKALECQVKAERRLRTVKKAEYDLFNRLSCM